MVMWCRRLSRALRKKDDVGCAEGCLNNYLTCSSLPGTYEELFIKKATVWDLALGRWFGPLSAVLVVLPGAVTVPKSENSKG